jgi:hypothetical protein
MISFLVPFAIWTFVVFFANTLTKEDKEAEEEERKKEIKEWNRK